jgi:hypothetical protein
MLVKGKSSSHHHTCKNVDYDDYDPNFERRLYLQLDYMTIFFSAQVELAFTRPYAAASYSNRVQNASIFISRTRSKTVSAVDMLLFLLRSC